MPHGTSAQSGIGASVNEQAPVTRALPRVTQAARRPEIGRPMRSTPGEWYDMVRACGFRAAHVAATAPHCPACRKRLGRARPGCMVLAGPSCLAASEANSASPFGILFLPATNAFQAGLSVGVVPRAPHGMPPIRIRLVPFTATNTDALDVGFSPRAARCLGSLGVGCVPSARIGATLVPVRVAPRLVGGELALTGLQVPSPTRRLLPFGIRIFPRDRAGARARLATRADATRPIRARGEFRKRFGLAALRATFLGGEQRQLPCYTGHRFGSWARGPVGVDAPRPAFALPQIIAPGAHP